MTWLYRLPCEELAAGIEVRYFQREEEDDDAKTLTEAHLSGRFGEASLFGTCLLHVKKQWHKNLFEHQNHPRAIPFSCVDHVQPNLWLFFSYGSKYNSYACFVHVRSLSNLPYTQLCDL